MFILPYVYHRHQLPHVTLYEVSMLTQGGTNLWKEDDGLRLTEDILEPNGLFTISHRSSHGVHFCYLDESKLDMSEYFHWKDTIQKPDDDLFCWRSYYFILPPSSLSSSLSSSWLPFPVEERLGPYSCQELVTEILSYNTS